MKFKDISQFTSAGNWQADYSLTHFVREIDRMVKEDGLQLNPDFQRGNVWNEKQQIAYVEFILRGGFTSRVVYLNNPNWHRLKNKTYTEFVCIDGLQRITALSRFVKNEIHVFGYLFKEYEDEAPIVTNGLSININDLQSKREVLQWYIDFNSGGTVHSKEDIDRVKRLIELEKENAK